MDGYELGDEDTVGEYDEGVTDGEGVGAKVGGW